MARLIQPEKSLMQTYRVGLHWRLFLYIVSVALLVPVYLLLRYAIYDTAYLSMPFIFSCAGVVALLALATYIVLSTIRHRIIVGEEGITEQGPFGSTHLRYDEIKGYWKHRSQHILLPYDNKRSSVAVSDYLQSSDELMFWLVTTYERIEKLEYEERLAELSADTYYSEGKDEDTIAIAERWQRWIRPSRWISIALAIISLFWTSEAYMLWFALSVSLPLIAIVIYNKTRGLVHIYPEEESPYPSMAVPTYTAVCILFIIALRDVVIMEHSQVYLPMCLIALVWAILFMRHDLRLLHTRRSYLLVGAVFVVGTGLMYGYALVTLSNYLFDKSTPDIERVAVLDKYTRRGKSRSYNLELSPWGELKENEHVRISSKMYDRVSVGDTVSVYIYQGRFDIPYYEVRED